VWAITFGFEQAAAFQNKHTHGQHEQGNADPVYFFHNFLLCVEMNKRPIAGQNTRLSRVAGAKVV
jgi:hypothetical protein